MDFVTWKYGDLIEVVKNQNFLEYIWNNKYWLPFRSYGVLMSSIEFEHIIMIILHAAILIFSFVIGIAYVDTNRKKSVLKNIATILITSFVWYIVYMVTQIPMLLHFYHYLRGESQTSFYILIAVCVVCFIVVYSIYAAGEKKEEERYHKRIKKGKMTVLDVDYISETCEHSSYTTIVPAGKTMVPISQSLNTSYRSYYCLILKDLEKKIYRAALYREDIDIKPGDTIRITELTKKSVSGKYNFIIEESQKE